MLIYDEEIELNEIFIPITDTLLRIKELIILESRLGGFLREFLDMFPVAMMSGFFLVILINIDPLDIENKNRRKKEKEEQEERERKEKEERERERERRIKTERELFERWERGKYTYALKEGFKDMGRAYYTVFKGLFQAIFVWPKN
jgi:hypothetical protein